MAPPDAPQGAAPRTARSHSISSDKPSLSGHGGFLSLPVSISPHPTFIAASAASQIVTNDHDSQADSWFDQHGVEPSSETALVALPALNIVNRFLDQLLFNFLSISRSTSLTSLRPAVVEVLKPKLASEAINGADQELREYLGGGEDEELLEDELEPSGDWDLELVWKRTRLRCMVYSSLGDMEEEDEDFYTEQEQLDGSPGSNNQFFNNLGVVSPAVAIFLTSILEFMGEQVLTVAGRAAYHRLRVKCDKKERGVTRTHSEITERVVVEESDVERVALDRTLGRLWRGWKKRIRSPTISVSLPQESLRSQQERNRIISIAPQDSIEDDPQRLSLVAVAALAEHEYAAGIPLPLSADDVREIEIPGLAKQIDHEGGDTPLEDEVIRPQQRPKSLTISTTHTGEDTPTLSQRNKPILLVPKARKRPYSLHFYTSPSWKSPKNALGGADDDQNDTEKVVGSEKLEGQVTEPQGEEVNKETESPKESRGPVAGIIAGATAIGTAATGQTPETDLGQHEATDIEEEFSIEEPLVLTSARVSIGGPISPTTSRHSSVRSLSIHSLRLIDVPPPLVKSPARSGRESIDASDHVVGRPIIRSRPNSIPSPIDTQTPRIGSPVLRVANSSPLARVGSPMSSGYVRHGRDSISEEKEVHGIEPASMPTDPSAAMRGVDMETISHSQQFTAESSSRDSAPQAPKDRGEQNIRIRDSGAPPLTPLREMVEQAPDTSDEASSIAPSEAHSICEHVVNGRSPPVSGSSPAHTQRVVDTTRSVRPLAVNIPHSAHRRPSREDQKSSSNSHQQIHTPGSGSGSGSGSSSASHRLKLVRTFEEVPPSATEDKSQSFEQLIWSDQTIQYTLTPQNMRNIEATPNSPRSPASPFILNPQDFPRLTPSKSYSPSVTKFTGLYSHPPIERPKSSKSSKSMKVPKHALAPAANSGARLRSNAPQPRDARVERESMGDLAEFISSTAPPGSYDQLSVRSAPGVNWHRGMNGTARNASDSIPSAGTFISLPRRTESSSGRSKLQARDAAVPRGDGISDLIDFVRSGPQLEKENHRIPRTVAPFRTTLDSDQMTGATGGKAIDASLPEPRSSQTSTSVHSSINSQSALLNNSSKMNKPLPVPSPTNFDDEDMMPIRKTRRVRDMYEIDFSDEEEEFEALGNSRPKPIHEESLAEFLANVPPPPDPSPSPIYNTVSRSSSKIKKKSSSVSLMSRLGRKDSGPQPTPKPKSSGQDSRSLASRGGSRPPQVPTHIPISVQFISETPASYELARETGTNYASQLNSIRNKVAQNIYQPRQGVSSTTRTNDLAVFLRSDPPSSISTQSQSFQPTLQKEEVGAFHRMFGRKKVH